MTIGEWIRTCRLAAKLTQAQLGDALGVTKSNVSAWENDRHEPSYSQILKIAQVTKRTLLLPGLSVSSWLFPDVDPARIGHLSPAELNEVQTAMLVALNAIETRRARSGRDRVKYTRP